MIRRTRGKHRTKPSLMQVIGFAIVGALTLSFVQ